MYFTRRSKIIALAHDDKRGLAWVTFKQTTKLPFDAQTRQDVIIAERVIKAQARSDAPPEPEVIHHR